MADLVLLTCRSDAHCSATVDQLLAHRWVTGTQVATVQLTSALEELRRFNARRKFKAAVNTVQATISLQKTYSKAKSSSSADGGNSPRDTAEANVSATASPDAVNVELQ